MILSIALCIIILAVAGSFFYGQKTTKAKTVTEWAIGGRKFGNLVYWFLNAGEIYTTFAVLGISGFAWASGAPAFMSLCSVSLSAIVGYWLTPKIWQRGRAAGLVTQADFFLDQYGSKVLTVIVALAGIAALVVYVQIQITALGLIVRLAVGPQISPIAAAITGAALMLAFVFAAGLRSAAFAAGVKDVLMVLLVIGLGATIAHRVGASSILDVFNQAQQQFPGAAQFPGLHPEEHLTTTWLITASLNVALGTWIFPHMFQLSYSAADTNTIRRNAIWQPLYSLSYFFIIMLGFAALIGSVSPPGGDPNGVLLQLVADKYPGWVVGVLAGTACLLALVPGSVLLLTAGTIFTRNVVGPFLGNADGKTALIISRVSMIGFAAIAVTLALGGTRSLVQIGLSAYAAIGMLAPGVFLPFLYRRITWPPILAGIVVGYAVLVLPASTDFWKLNAPDWDIGLVALIINALVVTVAVLIQALVARPRPAQA